MTGISGWAGNGAGLICIGACIIMSWFFHRMPRFSRPWLHRAFIGGLYAGATAVTATPVGTFLIRMERGILGWFGGTSTGLGHAGITLAAVFLLATVVVALIWVPGLTEGFLAVALVFVLVLIPSGALHSFYVSTAIPGQHIALGLATWIGGA